MTNIIYEIILYYVSFFSTNKRKCIEYIFNFVFTLTSFLVVFVYIISYSKKYNINFFIGKINFFHNFFYGCLIKYENCLKFNILNYKILFIFLYFSIIVTLIIYILLFLFYLIISIIIKNSKYYYFYKNLLLNFVNLLKKFKLRNFVISSFPLFYINFIALIFLFFFIFSKKGIFLWVIFFNFLGNPLIYILTFLLLEKITFPFMQIIQIDNFTNITHHLHSYKLDTKICYKIFKHKKDQIFVIIPKIIYDYINKNFLNIMFSIIYKQIGYYYLKNIHRKETDKTIIFIYFYILTVIFLIFIILTNFLMNKISALIFINYNNLITYIIIFISSVIWIYTIIKLIETFYPEILLDKLNSLLTSDFLENIGLIYISDKDRILELNPYRIIYYKKEKFQELNRYIKEFIIIIIITILFMIIQKI